MYTLVLATPILLALSAGTLATLATNGTNAPNNSTTNPPVSNMNIVLYSGLNCNSNGTGLNTTMALPYGNQTIPYINNALMPVLSYSLSRATTLREQLDFSGPTAGMGAVNGDPEQCTLFHETTSPNSNGNTLNPNQCYGLLLGPAQCLRLSQRN